MRIPGFEMFCHSEFGLALASIFALLQSLKTGAQFPDSGAKDDE
jgi:hypothetical protein